MTITIEALEQLANSMEGDEAESRARLIRLIEAYARILAVREPKRFKKMPLEYRDEDGHWDNSFPPAQEYCNHAGPRLIAICM